MEDSMNTIIQLIRERMHINRNELGTQIAQRPSITYAQIQQREEALNCTLPDLLRAIYVEVGPQFNLLRLEELFTVQTRQNKRYLEAFGDDPVGRTYLAICDWGCGIYSCIDCANPLYPVLVYDATGGIIIPEHPSFEAGVAAWMNGDTPFTRSMKEDQFSIFVKLVTEARDLSIPQLLVLSEWIDKLLDEKA
jgi:hypothetical protein